MEQTVLLTTLLSGAIFIAIGLLMIVRPSFVAKKLRDFYVKYPLVRYAGQKQLTSRSSYIVVLGFLFVAIGVYVLPRIAFDTTPLMWAVLDGDEAKVKKLLSEGADPNAKTKEGNTVLHIASGAFDPESDRYNKENNVKPTHPENEAILRLLLEGGSDPNVEDNNEGTALILAIYHGRVKTVELLIKYGASVNQLRSHGSTPLMLSALHCLPGITKLLLGAGADPLLKNSNGKTALNEAMDRNCASVAKLLEG